MHRTTALVTDRCCGLSSHRVNQHPSLETGNRGTEKLNWPIQGHRACGLALEATPTAHVQIPFILLYLFLGKKLRLTPLGNESSITLDWVKRATCPPFIPICLLSPRNCKHFDRTLTLTPALWYLALFNFHRILHSISLVTSEHHWVNAWGN